MTEKKRFTYAQVYTPTRNGFYRIWKDDVDLNADEVCNCLNGQAETIQQLQHNKDWAENQFKIYRDGYKALQRDVKELTSDVTELTDEIVDYKKKVKETLQRHYDLTKETKDYHIAMILEALANEWGVELR